MNCRTTIREPPSSPAAAMSLLMNAIFIDQFIIWLLSAVELSKPELSMKSIQNFYFCYFSALYMEP